MAHVGQFVRQGALCVLLMLTACESTRLSSRMLHGVPAYYYDEVSLQCRQLQRQEGAYIFFLKDAGNCFGPSLVASAVFIWEKNGVIYKRTIQKADAETRKVVDRKFTFSEGAQWFDYVHDRRFDTVSAPPQNGWQIDPAGTAHLEFRIGRQHKAWHFEPTPFFTSPDSLHPMRLLVAQMLK